MMIMVVSPMLPVLMRILQLTLDMRMVFLASAKTPRRMIVAASAVIAKTPPANPPPQNDGMELARRTDYAPPRIGIFATSRLEDAEEEAPP